LLPEKPREPQEGEKPILRKESCFRVETDPFEPTAARLEHEKERDWFRGFRWWPMAELPDRGEHFAPSRLGELMRDLVRNGRPATPSEIEA